MILYYWIAAACGGVLLLLSFVMGDADSDVEFGGDVEAEVDFGEALLAWFPILSLRFLTFFATFGGLTGVALTVTEAANPMGTAILAGGVGYVSGLVANRLVSAVGKDTVSSELGPQDCIGEVGTMKLPASPDRPGVVRVQLRDRVIELTAEVTEGALAPKQKVLVYQAKDDGHVLVEPVTGENLS